MGRPRHAGLTVFSCSNFIIDHHHHHFVVRNCWGGSCAPRCRRHCLRPSIACFSIIFIICIIFIYFTIFKYHFHDFLPSAAFSSCFIIFLHACINVRQNITIIFHYRSTHAHVTPHHPSSLVVKPTEPSETRLRREFCNGWTESTHGIHRMIIAYS